MSSYAAPATVTTGTWTVDQAHSKVGFAVKHMGIANQARAGATGRRPTTAPSRQRR